MVDQDNYQGTMRVRVGPATLNFSGTILVIERDRDRWHAAMRLDGADRRVGGAVHAAMTMDLVEAAPQETELVIASDISFLGKLGELGQPVIRRKADSVIQEFARNLRQALAASQA
jgi:carbon monoxide dehydrogenase subunit G